MEQAPYMMLYGIISREDGLWNRVLGECFIEQAKRYCFME